MDNHPDQYSGLAYRIRRPIWI